MDGKKIRVVLLYPSVTVYGSGKVGANIPMGLLYIASYLKKNGIEVHFLDALANDSQRVVRVGEGKRYGMSDRKIKEKIKKIKPDYVGISTMFSAYWEDSVRMAKLVKEVDKKIIVFAGGSHVSVDPIEVARVKEIDMAVFGEGEVTSLEIVKGKKLDEIKGIAFRKGSKIIRNEARELIKDLDTLPIMAWEELDLTKYQMGGVTNMRLPVFPIVSSRGCPGHCLYCSVNMVWQHRWRGRSAKSMVDEMEMLVKDYGAREFAFQDDSVSVNKERMTQICDEIIKRKMDIKWTTPNGIAHWTLDKKLIKKMKKAGCYRITFGIESGDLELRRWVGKPYSLKQAKELTEYANKIGMWTLATNIIGFPYETKENMDKTFNFALNSDVDLALFFRLGPRPGTPIWEIFKKEGWLMKDKNLLFSEDVACQTKYFTGKEITEIQKEMYRKFLIKRYFHPSILRRIVQKIKTKEDFFYILRLSLIAFKLIVNLVSTKPGVTSKTLSV